LASAKCRVADRGIVTVSVAILATGLLFMTGIVVDGGRMLARYIEAHDVAASAARAAAQEVDRPGLYAGDRPHVVPSAAAQAATEVAGASGATVDHVSVNTDGSQVTVAVSMPQALMMLGGGTQTLSGSATVTAQRGVEGAS
jgi:Flp pilus assembly protein TadG